MIEKDQLKMLAIKLATQQRDSKTYEEWSELNPEIAKIINVLDPMMKDAEAIRFYTTCEKIAYGFFDR